MLHQVDLFKVFDDTKQVGEVGPENTKLMNILFKKQLSKSKD
jgi:hypothetical protein